jgi:hypothetical protein
MILETLSHKLFVARAEAAANTTFSDTLATAGDFANKPASTIDILDPVMRLMTLLRGQYLHGEMRMVLPK